MLAYHSSLVRFSKLLCHHWDSNLNLILQIRARYKLLHLSLLWLLHANFWYPCHRFQYHYEATSYVYLFLFIIYRSRSLFFYSAGGPGWDLINVASMCLLWRRRWWCHDANSIVFIFLSLSCRSSSLCWTSAVILHR